LRVAADLTAHNLEDFLLANKRFEVSGGVPGEQNTDRLG
jgi:hypothetical protein